MRSAKKQHPAEIAAEAEMINAIRAADHFLASLFVGAGAYEKAKASTVRGAIDRAAIMEHAHKAGTRRAMIYAVGKDGRATMLTSALIQRLRAMAGA